MKPEQQRIAIAEACGWKNVDAGAGRVWGFTTRHKGTPSESDVCVDIPDYLNDLNAMHEAEKVLTKANWGGYAAHLFRITDAHNHGISPNHHWLAVAFSTASQRAEAFLRTIGKWKEAK